MTKPKNPLPCSVKGCNRLRRGGKLCEMHYYRMRRYGDLKKRGHEKVYDRKVPILEHLVAKLLRGVRKLPNGCWISDTAIANPETGYREVVIDIHGRPKARQYAHRLSYRHFKGPIPRGRQVCHACDNPPCCNPDHLFVGTRRDNMEDMVSKGRHYRGQNNRPAFLTDANVLAMYRLYDKGELSQYEIGRRFGVHRTYVWLVLHGRRFRHLFMKHRRSEPM